MDSSRTTSASLRTGVGGAASAASLSPGGHISKDIWRITWWSRATDATSVAKLTHAAMFLPATLQSPTPLLQAESGRVKSLPVSKGSPMIPPRLRQADNPSASGYASHRAPAASLCNSVAMASGHAVYARAYQEIRASDAKRKKARREPTIGPPSQ
ncbi:unnamed protein product [Parajaminaea phylloscopi]